MPLTVQLPALATALTRLVVTAALELRARPVVAPQPSVPCLAVTVTVAQPKIAQVVELLRSVVAGVVRLRRVPIVVGAEQLRLIELPLRDRQERVVYVVTGNPPTERVAPQGPDVLDGPPSSDSVATRH